LSTLKLQASYISGLLREGQIEQAQAWLAELKETITEAHVDVREDIFSLRSRISSGTNLVPTLQEYLTKYHAYYGMDAHLVTGQGTVAILAPEAATQVMRIVQEALANVHRHAKTNQAWVRIATPGDGFRITVEDHGLGFDPLQLASERPGYGLQVMRERAQSLGGSLVIDSHPGGGTRIVVWVPSRGTEVDTLPSRAERDKRRLHAGA
jgi:two-component system nitrate/nitrite sensor histidine kinase NarX